MSDVLWFKGRFTTTDEPVFSVLDRCILFGDGVYETLKFLDRAPILVDAHWRRLCRSLEMLEMPNPWTAAEFVDGLTELIDRTDFDDGIIYLQVSRGTATSRSHAWPDGLEAVGFAYTTRFAFPDETMRRVGVAVISVPESRWARCEIKSVNLLPNALAKTAARRAGAYEAIFVDDGEVVEGSSSSFFAVVDGALVTRALGSELLPGTVRQIVLDLAKAADVPVAERSLTIRDLERASEAFLTSTTSWVLPVTRVDGRPVGGGSRGAITKRLQEAYEKLVRDEVAKWKRRETTIA